MPPTALFAFEPSTQTRTSIADAISFVTAIGARTLEVLHVLAPDRLAAMQAEQPDAFRYQDDVLDQLRANIRFELEEPCRQAGLALDVEVVTGDPVGEVLEHRDRAGQDYLLIGNRNRSRVGKLVFGSTAQQLLLRAPCPVLAIPTA